MEPLNSPLASSLFWQSALVVALLDGCFILLLRRFVQPAYFYPLKRPIVAISAVFWGLLWAIVLAWAWPWFYQYVFPAWTRWLLVPFFALFYAVVGWALWQLARLRGNPIINFPLLGGLVGLLTHTWAIYGAGIIEKVPLMQGVHPLPVLLFAITEYTFYWCAIFSKAIFVHRLQKWWNSVPHRPTKVA